jgi:hypothetical protein
MWPPFDTVVEFQLNVYGGDEAKYFPSTRKLTQLTDDELTWTEIGTVPETVAPVLGDVMTAACAKASAGMANPIAKISAKLRSENAYVDDFGRNMVNPPANSAVRNVCKSARHHLPSPEQFRRSLGWCGS